MTARAPGGPAAWEAPLAVTAFELALCRLTDRPPDAWAWSGALLWALLSAGWLRAAGSVPHPGAAAGLAWAWLLVHAGGMILPYHNALALPWWQTGFVMAVLGYVGSVWYRSTPPAAAGARTLPARAAVLVVGLSAWAAALPWAAHEWRLDPLWELRATVPLLLGAVALGRYAPALALVALWPAAPERWATDAPPPSGPDLLLITVDTLRHDEAATMRAFDGLLEAQAPAPWTLPSMATVMTGVDPGAHGAMQGEPQRFSAIAPEVATLAERLSAAGWDTAASVENAFVAPWRGFGRGFARFRYPDGRPALPRVLGGSHASPTGHQLLSAAGLLPAGAAAGGVHEHLADLDAFLADRRPDRPLFVWLHLLDAHLPYRHALTAPGLSLTERLLALRGNREQIGEHPDAATLDALHAAYRHEIAVLDAALVDALAALPPAPHGRLVVLTSDHGEAFGEHGGWEHGHDLHQTLLRVPLAVRRQLADERGAHGLPGRPLPTSAGTVDRPAALLDVAPTLLGAAGLPTEGLHGVDLGAVGAGATRPLRSANPLYGAPDRTAVRVGPAKLIAAPDGRATYDLAADPDEAHPGPDDAALGALLPAWQAGAEAPMDDATRRQLEALGYLAPR